MIKQNIVFVENRAGSLRKVTEILAEKNVDIYGFACFDAPEFALFRMVSNGAEKAAEALTENGFINRVTDVIAVDLKDEVGGLDEILSVVGESNISLDYIYTSYHRDSQTPVVIIHSEEIFLTESVLKNKGFKVLNSVDELQS
ncbi:MAG: amino acid-binding protein [Eubacteriales bacterium]|nr:amino acid-binding protein [Eubacteriales bacterium]